MLFVLRLLFAAGLVLGRVTFPGKLITKSSEVLSGYDYIVVGGGTSGLVVANRLSENPGKRTLRAFSNHD